MRISQVRKFALLIVKSVLEDGRWTNKLIVPYLFELQDARDRRLLTELVYGTVKMRLHLDWVISKFLKGYSLDELTPWIRNILRISAYQILFMERIPDYAAVSQGVQLAKRFGHRGVAALVNSVLRRIAENRPEPRDPWVKHSHPKWLYLRLLELWGYEKTVEFMMHNNKPPHIYLRFNQLKTDIDSFLKMLEMRKARYRKLEFPSESFELIDPPQLIDLPEETYFVQDFASQLVAHFIAPEEGMTIYDLAAAPGGKATHLAELMQDNGTIIAVEIHLSRAKEMQRVVNLLGTNSVLPIVADSRQISFGRKADIVFMDVPCSGLGTLRRRPELRWRMTPQRIDELVEIQKDILENGSRFVRPNGLLVYTTCTIEPRENELQIQKFLERHPEFEIEPPPAEFPTKFLRDKFLYVDGARFQCDYMFGVRLRKRG